MFDSQTQNRGTSTSTSMKKASSTANVADDLSALFGGGTDRSRSMVLNQCPSKHLSNCVFHLFVILAPTSSDEFQEVDGESEERRRARLERHQRTRERAVMCYDTN
jgi:hypothetical protein